MHNPRSRAALIRCARMPFFTVTRMHRADSTKNSAPSLLYNPRARAALIRCARMPFFTVSHGYKPGVRSANNVSLIDGRGGVGNFDWLGLSV